jgi:radical SAM protein with 4Fe4S-binding SPASM domain
MAVISNMFNKKRVDLADAIPLATPFVMQLEPSGFCNLKCAFCPVNDDSVGHLLKKDMMCMDTFIKFADDCARFPDKIKILRIIGNGEPLLNKNIAEMVKHAKVSGAFEKVEITTNGTLLVGRIGKLLIDAGLDILKISLEAIDDDMFFTISKTKVRVLDLKKNIEYFFKNRGKCVVYIKTTDLALTCAADRERFLREYGEICDYVYIENVSDIWPEYGAIDGARGRDANRYGRIGGGEVCVQPFKLMSVCADGEVLPCCADWQRKLSLGNIHDTPLVEIWNGRKMLDVRLSLLGGAAALPCSDCNFQKVSQDDNITGAREIISEKLKELRNA